MASVPSDVNPAEDYLDAVEGHEPAATREVAEAVGVTQQGAYYRLQQLQDEGLVRSKKVGRELVWMLAD